MVSVETAEFGKRGAEVDQKFLKPGKSDKPNYLRFGKRKLNFKRYSKRKVPTLTTETPITPTLVFLRFG